MHACDRRTVVGILAAAAGLPIGAPAHAQNPAGEIALPRRHHFAAEAERMRAQAVASGDQSFGAVVVKDDAIVGWGPSRVVLDRDPTAHAERVALRDAQQRLGSRDLTGATLVSTSRACPMCEGAAHAAGVSRMYWGPGAIDAGPPKRL